MPRRKKSLLQRDGKCFVCERQCSIKESEKGYCSTKVNDGGIIYTLNYGNISSISINPIEKKPFFHFYPGSYALTVGYWSCNFDCPWCQNYDISKIEPQYNEYIDPKEFVCIALRHSCGGTSLSFNEPVLSLEWGIEVFEIARKKGLYNTIVTNGYMTEKTLNYFIRAGLDAANVDVKGDEEIVKNYCHADVQKVWRNCKIMRNKDIHLEITTLVIPSINDDMKILSGIGRRILEELGSDTPWHLTMYFPAYKFVRPPVSVKFLEGAYEMAKKIGLEFVYLGNVPGHRCENTYCPKCNELLVGRQGMAVVSVKIEEQCVCPNCGKDLKNSFVI